MHGNGKMFNNTIRDLVSNVNIDSDPVKDSQNGERVGDNAIDKVSSGMHDQGDRGDLGDHADHADHAGPVSATDGTANGNDQVSVDA